MNLSNSTLTKSDFSWYVLFTMPNHEKIVCGNLHKKGIETFLPLRKEIRTWSDRKVKIEAPCFPNYIFVNIRKVDRYRVFEVPGIVRYLDSNQNPTTIREKEINIIRKLVVEENFEVTTDNFIKGDAVMITSGPLQNLKGVLVDRKGTKRLLLEIESIKRNLLIDVAAYNLMKIQQPEEEALLC